MNRSQGTFRTFGALALAATMLTPGCATDAGRRRPESAARPTPMPSVFPLPESRRSADGSLSLLDAQTLAARRSPELAGLGWAVDAEAERVGQAAALPNPELLVEVEDMGGSRNNNPITATFWMAQRFELGGKRGRRVDVADSVVDVAEMEHALGFRALTSRVTEDFVEVLTAQRRVALYDDLLARTQGGVSRLEADRKGSASHDLDLTRARVEVSRTRLDRNRAQASLAAARVRLLAEMGGEARLGSLEGDLDRLAPPPVLADLLAAADASPMLVLWTKELARRKAALAVERAQRIPDVTLAAGYRRISGFDENTAVLAVGLPIPLFDRNRGNVAAAGDEVIRARAQREAARLALRTDLSVAYERLVNAYQSAIELRETLVPGSQQAYDDTRAAFARGVVSFVAVIEARRTAYRLRMELLSAQGEYHRAVAEIEELVDLDIGPDL